MTITKTDLTDSICKGLGLHKSRSSELVGSSLKSWRTQIYADKRR